MAVGRVLALVVTDSEGWESDSAQIELDDRGGDVAIPRAGAELAIALGWAETGVRAMGRYVSGEVEASGPPAKLVIRATGVDFLRELKQRRTRSWDDTTVGGIASEIAGEHGLQARVTSAARLARVEHADQAGESDMALLLRLCRERGLECKIDAGRVVIAAAGEGRTHSGLSMEVVAIAPGDASRYRISWLARSSYGSVEARWRDVRSGRTRVERAGSGSPVSELRKLYSNSAEAAEAARARLSELRRDGARLSMELSAGDSRLVAESRIRLDNWRPGVPAEWRVTKAVHRISDRGYTCEITAGLPSATM